MCPHKMNEVILRIQMCERFHESAKGALVKGAEKQHNVMQ